MAEPALGGEGEVEEDGCEDAAGDEEGFEEGGADVLGREVNVVEVFGRGGWGVMYQRCRRCAGLGPWMRSGVWFGDY